MPFRFEREANEMLENHDECGKVWKSVTLATMTTQKLTTTTITRAPNSKIEFELKTVPAKRCVFYSIAKCNEWKTEKNYVNCRHLLKNDNNFAKAVPTKMSFEFKIKYELLRCTLANHIKITPNIQSMCKYMLLKSKCLCMVYVIHHYIDACVCVCKRAEEWQSE